MTTYNKDKGKDKGKALGTLGTCHSTAYMSQDLCPDALYNLRSGSWLAWVNDTAAHYAANHHLC